jgi:glycosyltransferase involved in cell wall biosynthesis
VNVLLLSAYAARSHCYWQDTLQQMLPEWNWQVLSLPPRHFGWRMRGSPLYWALQQREVLQQPHDRLLATSMVDLATLRGLVPALARLPSALYFHENQFGYPPGDGPHGLLEAQMVSLYSALAADLLLFNSAYNRSTFLDGVATLLGRMPDRVPPAVADLLAGKSRLLPVPVELAAPDAARQTPARAATDARPLHLLWNHRWEYDKGPDRLLLACQALLARGVAFTLSVVGQQFRRRPRALDDLQRLLEQSDCATLAHFGHIQSRHEYVQLLRQADVVLSTALHDFQGLAVLEATACGCYPLVPDRLAYVEYLPAQCRYPSCPDDPAQEAAGLAQAIAQRVAQRSQRHSVDLSRFAPGRLTPRYRELLERLAISPAG